MQLPTADSYGGVVVSGGGKVLLREPTKHHGGYAWTLAKTEAKPGESPRDAALRAVREKTGYDAEIRISIPGVFNGSSSSTCYYVMDARHPPSSPNWQTSGLRWVTFDEARDLIRLSSNTDGSARDLSVLNAAAKAADMIPYNEHPSVQPEDWPELKSMPARHTVLRPQLRFSPDEMKRIQRGFFPTVMEQKWFLYFTGNRLRMHRSWTGFLIFDVGFASDAQGAACVTEVIANRESREYGCTDDAEDLRLLNDIIRYHLLEQLDEPAVDGLVKAIALASQPKYLGSPDVVTALVKEVFDVAVRAIADEATEDDFVQAVEQVALAFTEDDAGYTRMPGWHSAEQMGANVKKYLLGSDPGEDLAEIIRHGMAAVLAKLLEMLGDFLKDPAANWENHALVQLNAAHQFVVAVMLGTNTVKFGERTLSDFRWVPVAVGAQTQTILEVASESGQLTLCGIQSPSGWQFRIEAHTASQPVIEDISKPSHRPWVDTLRSALKQLDTYHWTQLQAVAVHPEFRERVFKALKTRQKKGLIIDWERWADVLHILEDEA